MPGDALFPMAAPPPRLAPEQPWPHPWHEGFTDGAVPTPVGDVPRVRATLTAADRWGAFKLRWGWRRMQVAVRPGLYALGSPGPEDPVLVSASYALSLDHLRSALPGRSAWIQVLDTRGVNVWCAAGKGTFGTDELARRVAATRLSEVVKHRRLIVPQLGAVGVGAAEVRRRTGFGVTFGPVEARDLPAFLDAGLKATPAMRRKRFPLVERAVLIPVELVTAMRWLLILAPLAALLSGLGAADYWEGVRRSGLLAAGALAAAVVAGGILTPLLLPWLPGRAFSVKGAAIAVPVLGALVAALGSTSTLAGRLEAGGWVLLGTALAAFLAVNFTGASTYTSLSGVRRELRIALPVQLAAGGLGLALWIGARFLGPGG
jgi:acetyl-CoA decarbonylase/synthase complex subunit gamma